MGGTIHHEEANYRIQHMLRAAAPEGVRVVNQPGVRLISVSTTNFRDFGAVDYRAYLNAMKLNTLVFSPHDCLLAGEIVSKSSKRRDRIEKPIRYAAAGIPNFLLIDLQVAECPHVKYFTLEGGYYSLRDEAGPGEMITVDAPIPIRFDPAVLISPDWS